MIQIFLSNLYRNVFISINSPFLNNFQSIVERKKMSSISTPKTHTAGSGLSEASKGSSLRRRRTKLVSEKRIADDEFMAAAIGDVEWLKQSLKDAGADINFDKNVCNFND